MNFDMSLFAELNTATKYPSIETYHVLGERGMLTEDLGPFAGIDPDETVYVTEKVDGTNGRIVLLPGEDYFIGSREELLYAKGDRVKTPNLGIIPELWPVAEQIVKIGGCPADKIMVLYFEVYGGKIGGQAKQYSRKGTVGHRLFDVALIDLDTLELDRAHISSWRDAGRQPFLSVNELGSLAMSYGLETVPYLTEWTGSVLPETVEEMSEALQENISETFVGLDGVTDWTGKPEGLVLRTPDRSRIAKARFQDYERTLKRRK